MIQLIVGGLLVGLVGLLAAAPLSKLTKHGPKIGNIYAAIAMQTLQRPAISISPNTDFSLRRRSFDDQYVSETISAGDSVKRITKIPNSVHRWGKRPFAFVDELYGDTFDLRDVLVGRREHEHKKDGGMVYQDYKYDNEGRLVGLSTYVRAFIELERRQPLSMELEESIHPITDGAEDADAWKRTYEAVKRMFLPYQDSTGLLKLALPMIALLGGFLAGFYLFGPAQLPGETGTTVSVGAHLLLLLGLRDPGDDDDRDGRDDDAEPTRREQAAARLQSLASRVAGKTQTSGGDAAARLRAGASQTWEWLQSVRRVRWLQLAIGLVLAAVLGVGLLISVTGTLVFVVSLAATVLLLPLLSATAISALPGVISEPIAEAWMTLGLKAFDDPIVRQTATDGYRIDEADELGPAFDGTGDRYRFCKSWVGFTCDVEPEAFGNAAVKGSKLGEYRSTNVVTDGGDVLPDDVEPTEKISNADHLGLVPSFEAMDDQRRRATFVRTDRWLARFKNAATGKMAERAQKEATKEFAGGEPPFTDRQIMLYSLGTLVGGLAFSFILFGGV